MKFDYQPIWPTYRVLLVVAALVVLVLTTYPKRIRHLRPFDRRLLLGLRLATVGLIALAMLRPAIKVPRSENSDEKQILYILADSSRSMKTLEGVGTSGSQSRRAYLLKTVAASQPILEELPENVEIRYFDFAESLTSVDKLSDEADGRQTDMANALRELLKQTRGKNVYGIVMMGDGAPRVLNKDERGDVQEQILESARDFREQGTPIHTVVFGGAGTQSNAGDLIVQNVRYKTNPYEGKVVTVTADVRAIGARGRRLTAKLLVENRNGQIPPASGEMVEARPLKTSRPKNNNIIPKSNDEVLNQIELSFVPTRPGKYKIAFQVEGLPDEPNTVNNTVTRIINVQSGGISVAYFDRLRPEQRWIRNVSASDKIQLDYFQVNTGGGFGPQTKIDPEIFRPGPGEYDVFLIGDVPARIFGNEILGLLKKRVQDGAGFMMIGGYDSFGPGGYAGTPVAEMLPVEMTRAEFATRQANPNSPTLHHNRELQMIPTDLGLTRFVMRIDPAGNHAALWKKLAPLSDANRLRKKNTAGNNNENLIEVLATAPDGTPLLLSHVWSGSRVMAFGGDTTYQWYLNGQQAAHQRFWRQVILFLAGKEEGSEPIWARIEKGGKRNFGLDDKIPLMFGARDDKKNPVLNLNFEIQVMGPPHPDEPDKPFVRKIQVSGDRPENLRELKSLKYPGEYWIRVVGRKTDPQKTIVGTAWERFIVESSDLELDDTTPDPDVLKSISSETGGTFIENPEKFNEFLKRLNAPDDDDQSGTDTVTLWDTWPHLDDKGNQYLPGLLLMFVVLISLEWFFRKRRGLV
ncbi:MAG: hypothetical protein Tsb009_36070 [Planctomycetaceae bacterium]